MALFSFLWLLSFGKSKCFQRNVVLFKYSGFLFHFPYLIIFTYYIIEGTTKNKFDLKLKDKLLGFNRLVLMFKQ